MHMYMYLRKCADAERGLELSCACMALLMASTQPKRSVAMKRYSAPLGSLRREGGSEGGSEREGERGQRKRKGGKESILKNRSCSDYDAGLYNHTALTHTSLIFTVYICIYIHIHEQMYKPFPGVNY